MKRFVLLLIPLVGLGWVNPGPLSPPPRPRVGNDLDAVIQERFGHVTDEDIRVGRLGVSRVAPPSAAHLARRFRVENPAEVLALKGLEDSGWSASMYVLGLGGAFTGPILTGSAALPEPPNVEKVRLLAGRSIKTGKALQDAWGPYSVEARLIRVSGPSCAACHDPALKEGDALGSVVYLFHPVVPAP